MSELTRCNYCTLQVIKREATELNQIVTLHHTDGFDIYVHPKTTPIMGLSREAREKYFRAWFMGLTRHCVC